jgi:hypothetical protein
MPGWLWRSIVGVSALTAVVATLQWGACRFYVLPQVWPWLAKQQGAEQSSRIDPSPLGCTDADGRTITVLMTLLTTLTALSRKAD